MKINASFKLASLTIALILSLGCLGAKSQTKPNFSGHWIVNLDKSENGEGATSALDIVYKGDTIAIKRVEQGGGSFVEKITLDGKKFTSITTSGRPKTGTAKWDEGRKSFTETAVLGEPGNSDAVAFNVTEQWSLSADGKELSVYMKIGNSDGAAAERKAVYDKQ